MPLLPQARDELCWSRSGDGRTSRPHFFAGGGADWFRATNYLRRSELAGRTTSMRKPGRLSLWVRVPRSCFTNASRIRKPKPLRAGTLPTPRSATINRRSVRFSIKVISMGPAAPAYAYLFALIRSSVSKRPRLIARSVGNKIAANFNERCCVQSCPMKESVSAQSSSLSRRASTISGSSDTGGGGQVRSR